MKTRISEVPIPQPDSFTLRNDLAERRLSLPQVETVMAWLARQPPSSRVPAADLQNYFEQENFSPGEIEAVMLTLIKEDARPAARYVIALMALGLLAFVAFFAR